MAVPSSVVNHAFTEAFRNNGKVIKRSGTIAASTPYEATIAFNTQDGKTVAVKWSTSSGYKYLG